jgi:hypothetical protein
MRGSYARKFRGLGLGNAPGIALSSIAGRGGTGTSGEAQAAGEGHLKRPQEDELEDDWPLNSSGAPTRESQKMPTVCGFGAEGDRTPDLLIAKDELFGSCATLGQGGSGKLGPTPAARRGGPRPS